MLRNSTRRILRDGSRCDQILRVARQAVVWTVLVGALVHGLGVDPAWARSPRPMDGKRTLYQKVLIRPGAVARTQPDLSIAGEPIDPFSAFFVYDRRNIGGVEWLEIGGGREGGETVFVQTDKTIDWKQSMTLLFTNPAGRMDADGPRLSLFLKDKPSLVDLLKSEALVPTSRKWRAEAKAAKASGAQVPADNPVVALEPDEHVDYRERFYLLPILEAENTLIRELRAKLLLMRVASLTEEEEAPPVEPSFDDFKVGVVFVVDTSASMNPYINRTKKTIETIFNKIRDSDMKSRVSFGMVGFRDSVEAVPRLEYRTKVFAPLETVLRPDDFLERVAQMSEAQASSRGFMEDALGGLDAAMSMPGWEGFNAKFLVLITDASTRSGQDELGSIPLEPRDFNTEARAREFGIQILHLKTPAGKNDHDAAEAQYKAISRFDDVDLYYPIETGSVSAFGEGVDTAAEELLELVRAALDDQLVNPVSAAGTPSRLLQVGLAMQLAYLGQQTGAQAPDVIDSWITDRDFEDVRKATVEPRVLLTKNQLNDLKVTIERIIELQQSNRLNPNEFFARLQSVAGNMVRDPSRIASGQVETLGEVLGEYLDDLPYESEIMSLTEERFLSMGPVPQAQLVRGLKSKVEAYRRFDGDSELWIKLAADAPEGERVYPVPLSLLP